MPVADLGQSHQCRELSKAWYLQAYELRDKVAMCLEGKLACEGPLKQNHLQGCTRCSSCYYSSPHAWCTIPCKSSGEAGVSGCTPGLQSSRRRCGDGFHYCSWSLQGWPLLVCHLARRRRTSSSPSLWPSHLWLLSRRIKASELHHRANGQCNHTPRIL